MLTVGMQILHCGVHAQCIKNVISVFLQAFRRNARRHVLLKWNGPVPYFLLSSFYIFKKINDICQNNKRTTKVP